VSFFKERPAEADVVPESAGSSFEGVMSADQVKKVMISADWGAGNSQWSRYLDLADCVDANCKAKLMFSSSQICSEEESEEDVCSEVELEGTIQFVEGGFNFSEDTKPESIFCTLKRGDSSEQWQLEGPQCLPEFTQLLGTQKQ